MVPGAGLEPARSCLRGILSPLCLPIPPPGQENLDEILSYQILIKSILKEIIKNLYAKTIINNYIFSINIRTSIIN